mmetsp:Transcript_17403/g.32811  ORF Transcript_17403/g.32811 Transcript_17403/m.32811 type:complete len:370 (+) Transcript_17403:76-1185(+)
MQAEASPGVPAAGAASSEGGAPDRPAADGAKATETPVSAAAVLEEASQRKRGKAASRAADEAGTAAPPKSAVPAREDNLTYDLAHLAAFDIAPLHPKADLLAQTRDNVQLLVNKIFSLPRKDTDEGAVIELPTDEVFRLPRQRPVPKVKAKTRWEKFMEERNMRKRKRSRLVWDETSQDWRPRYGFKSVKQGQDKNNGIMEVKEGQDPYANPFEKNNAEKKLHMARQKMREVRNRVEAAGGKLRASVPDLSGGVEKGGFKRGKEGLKEAIRRAQTSSGSIGKFDRVAPNEPTNLNKRRKVVEMPKSAGEEKERYLKAASRLLSGEGGVDTVKAAKAGAGIFGGEAPKGKPKAALKRRSKAGGRSRKARR